MRIRTARSPPRLRERPAEPGYQHGRFAFSASPRPGPATGRTLPAVRAARFVGPGVPIELRDVPDPAPGANDVVVQVEACGICASDLHFIHGEMPLPVPPPLTLGHEASGTIAAVGAEVPGWRDGARVAVTGGKACMVCQRCMAGRLEE